MKIFLIVLLIILLCVITGFICYHFGAIKMEDALDKQHKKEVDYLMEKHRAETKIAEDRYKNLTESDAQLNYLYNYVLAVYVNHCANFRKELQMAKVVCHDKVIGIRIKINNKDVVLPITKNIPVAYNCPTFGYNRELIKDCDKVTAELINYLHNKYSK